MLRLYREFSCPIWHRLNLRKNHTYVWALIPTTSWENVMQSLNNVNRIHLSHCYVKRLVLVCENWTSSVSKRLAVFLAGHITCCTVSDKSKNVQGGWVGWPTENGKKLSNSQAQLGQATCLAVAYFLSISGGLSTPSALYMSLCTITLGRDSMAA